METITNCYDVILFLISEGVPVHLYWALSSEEKWERGPKHIDKQSVARHQILSGHTVNREVGTDGTQLHKLQDIGWARACFFHALDIKI